MSEAVISAFNWVPDFAKGLVRDLRIRWACEEIGKPYSTHLLHPRAPRDEGYREWQPFGQVPAFEDGDLRLFESGAILLYLGEQDERLLPVETRARWEAISWLIAGLNSIEPILNRVVTYDIFHAD
ncbi:MAG TPA: glutathione S-transferase N-terminal domain-containing protein, partial [Sphingomonadaceae bacterium]|nr:glutathione S-transferase N-terminal domain-containing protein [Sphingomonadaceae bacterium]